MKNRSVPVNNRSVTPINRSVHQQNRSVMPNNRSVHQNKANQVTSHHIKKRKNVKNQHSCVSN